MNYIAAVAVGINILLNIMLIGRYNVLGAAIANIATQTMVALMQIIICFSVWKFKLHKTYIFRYTLFIITSIGTVCAFVLIGNYWVMSFLGSILVICALSLVVGVLSIKQVFKAMRLKAN